MGCGDFSTCGTFSFRKPTPRPNACVGAIMCISKPVYVYVRALRACGYAYPLNFSPKLHGFWVVIECECQQRHTTNTHTRYTHMHIGTHEATSRKSPSARVWVWRRAHGSLTLQYSDAQFNLDEKPLILLGIPQRYTCMNVGSVKSEDPIESRGICKALPKRHWWERSSRPKSVEQRGYTRGSCGLRTECV